MSRFSVLKQHLSLKEAVLIYLKMKLGKWNNWKLNKLKYPFSLRNNPYDFATFEEVLLREDYNLEIPFPPTTIIDAGANIGLTAIYFANKYPQAKIISLEPEQENFEMLSHNTEKYKNIFPVKAGLWYKKALLAIKDNGEGNNAFTVEEVAATSENTIEALSISDIMVQQQWEKIDLVKIDIEGSETKLFESGYENWLPHTKILVIELHERMVPGCTAIVFKAIGQYNFTKKEQGENLVFINNEMV